MKRMKITAGHQQLMPFLALRKAEDFIDFIRKLFNAQEMVRKLDAQKNIVYSEIRIGDSTLILSEVTASEREKPSAFYIYVNDTDKTYFQALDRGAVSLMAPMDEEDDIRCAGFADPFGNHWWITTMN